MKYYAMYVRRLRRTDFFKVFVRSFVHSFIVESWMRRAELTTKCDKRDGSFDLHEYSRIDILIFSESYEWDIVTVKICKFIYR